MIIDGHLHLDHELPLEQLVNIMDQQGVDKTVLFSGFWEGVHYVSDWLPAISRTLLSSDLLKGLGFMIYNSFHKRDVTIKGKHHDIAVRLPPGTWSNIPMYPENEPVARARDKYPDRFIPFVFLNAMNNPELIKQFEKWVDGEGFNGVKIHTWSHPFDLLGPFLEVAKAAESRGIPLLMHMGGTTESSNVQGLLEACPNLKIILAHSGIPFFQRSQDQAINIENLYLDLSGPYLASPGFLKKIIDKVGAHKLIFGSDGAWGLVQKDNTFSYAPCINRMKVIDLPQKDFTAIMGGNMTKILEK